MSHEGIYLSPEIQALEIAGKQAREYLSCKTGIFPRRRLRAICAKAAGSDSPPTMARSISRPETPITSDITLLSFRLASSNTFRIRFPIRTCSCFQRGTAPRQIPQLLNRLRRHEATLQQAVLQEIRDPLAILQVGFPAPQGLHLRRVGQQQLELPLLCSAIECKPD